MEAVYHDPLLPGYWFDKPLIYTTHAIERCVEREIEQLDYLPITSKLADCDKDSSGNVASVCFKIDGENPYYIVLSVDGCVITVFNYDKKSMKRYSHRKNKRRFYEDRLGKVYGNSNHKLILSKKF